MERGEGREWKGKKAKRNKKAKHSVLGRTAMADIEKELL